MNDLSQHPPRRWNVQIDGICWLPRLIDKARAYDAGTLGHYFFGHSPVDGSLLGVAGLKYRDILEATRIAPDDAGVLAELERRAPGASERMRAWTARPTPVNAFVFQLVDADEGYSAGPMATLARALPLDEMVDFVRKAIPRHPER